MSGESEVSPINRIEQLHDQIPQVQNRIYESKLRTDPKQAQSDAAREVLWLARDRTFFISTNDPERLDRVTSLINEIIIDYSVNSSLGSRATRFAIEDSLMFLNRFLRDPANQERTIEENLNIAIRSGELGTANSERILAGLDTEKGRYHSEN